MFSTTRHRALTLAATSGALLTGLLVAPLSTVAAAPIADALPIVTDTSAVMPALVERAELLTIKRASATQQAEERAAEARVATKARAVARAAALRKSAVSIGLSRKGMAYSAGSSGPRAFDCSGFTSWVWRQAGRPIARTSWDQYGSLPRISRSAARPGDLVFFFGRGAHHVGLYIGDNKMIHAANYGTGVTISSLDENWYASRLSGFRRVA